MDGSLPIIRTNLSPKFRPIISLPPELTNTVSLASTVNDLPLNSSGNASANLLMKSIYLLMYLFITSLVSGNLLCCIDLIIISEIVFNSSDTTSLPEYLIRASTKAAVPSGDLLIRYRKYSLGLD